MRGVNGMSLSGAGVACKRLPAVIVPFRIVGLAVVLDEIGDERVRACRVIGRIGEVQDVLDAAVREADLVFVEGQKVAGRESFDP